MTAYRASDEEALRARDFLKDWAGEGFLSKQQHQLAQQETVCDLRRTNIFLRIVLFLFTLIIVGAACGLFFTAFLSRSTQQLTGVTLMIFAAISYAATVFAVFTGRLYRYGIEEALAVCSVGFFCMGMLLAISPYSTNGVGFLVPSTGALLSLWIWLRFGLPYAPLAAMIFLAEVPGYWTSSHSAQHLIVAAFYAAGLCAVILLRPRDRFTYLDQKFSIAEAFLWLGVYLALNLQLSSLDLLEHWWNFGPIATDFSKPFYWTTWVLTWCLPPAIFLRGLRQRDRFIMDAGAVAVILTLITNKPYLGWPRHTWDPMLLGALLIGVAFFLRRWLDGAPSKTRHGFTAQRLSGKDKALLGAGASALGLLTPNQVTPSPQPTSPDVHFGGGDSGGAGASSDF